MDFWRFFFGAQLLALVILCCLIGFSIQQQSNGDWTWLAGNKTTSAPGVYGHKGVPSTLNYPGARTQHTSWYLRSKRELWIFGGSIAGSWYNDLWRYRFSDGTWTWMHGTNTLGAGSVFGTMGVADPANMPSGRVTATGYNVNDEELWLLAGTGVGIGGTGPLQDLWRFRINDTTWTFMNGTGDRFVVGVYGTMGVPDPANYPSCRTQSTGWYDPLEHALWVHAGFCKSASGNGPCGETWRYRINEGTWAWMTGVSTRGYGATYGTKFVPSTSNTPGTRIAHVGFFDPDTREYWSYSGGLYSDMFRFRLNDSTWTWMSGPSGANPPGNYGPKGVANTTFYPGGRQYASGYYNVDTKEFWLFGGEGYSAPGNLVGQLNDMWKFRTDTLEWTWLSGSSFPDVNSTYGTLGVSDPSNMPGGRQYPSVWYEQDLQQLFLWGGQGWPEPGSAGTAALNDFWSGNFASGPTVPRAPTVRPPTRPPAAPPVASTPVAPAPVQEPAPILRVVITSTSSVRPNESAVCSGFMEYLNLSPADLSCIPEISVGSTNQTRYYNLLLTMENTPGRTAFAQLQSNSTLQSNFLATIATSTSGAYTGLDIEFRPPSLRPCLIPSPQDAVCDSSRGVWIIDRSVTVANTTTYIFIAPTEVRGDFTSGPNTTVVLSYQPASLTITGCAKFEGNLVLNGPPVTVSANTSYLLATYSSLCPSLPGDPPSKFSTVSWDVQPRPQQDCQTVSTTPEYAPTQLSVLITVDSSKCSSSNAVAGISAGATAGIVVGVGAFVAIIIVSVILYRKFLKPKNILDQQELALAATNNGDVAATTTSSASATGKPKKGKKKGETEYAAIDIDAFNAEREGSAQIVSIPAADVKMLQRLGGGAYGDVWLGQMRDGAFVAVKRMKNSVLAAHAAAFFSEASIMMQVTDNAHVVQMYGMIADEGEYGLVMEFMAGGSLETYLNNLKSKLPADSTATGEAIFVLRNEARLFDLTYIIASGLSCLASHGIVHRDLSARNILLDETKTFAKVSDFGLSRRLDDKTSKGKTVSSVGPIRWMSPENIRDKVYSEKSDVWSFGCTLIELLTGEVPFYSFNGGLSELAVAIRDSNASPLELLEIDVKARRLACPKWCIDLLRRCFAVNPADRPTFDEIREMMKHQRHELYVSLMDRLENREAILNQLLPSSSNEGDGVSAGNYGPFALPSSSSSSSGIGNRGSKSSKRSSAKMRGSVRLNRDAIGKAVDSPVHLLCRLGEGSFGAVFLASIGGSYIAVKQLSLPDSANVGASERAKAEGLIYSEAAIMAKLKQNRNVIAIYGLAVEGEKMSIMMEFAARGSLESFVQKNHGKIPETLLFRWAIGVARGMAGLAAQKIVHRDLAARNVLLDSTFEPKISDFGLSRDIDADETAGKTTSHVGPIRWMAPESLRQQYSEKSDVWAYGCVLVEILSGDTPYGNIDLHDIVIGVRDNRWTPLNVRDAIQAAKCDFSWMQNAPDYLIKLVELCFEKDPADRPTFAKIVQHLEENIPEQVASVEARREKQRQKRAKLIEAMDQIVV